MRKNQRVYTRGRLAVPNARINPWLHQEAQCSSERCRTLAGASWTFVSTGSAGGSFYPSGARWTCGDTAGLALGGAAIAIGQTWPEPTDPKPGYSVPPARFGPHLRWLWLRAPACALVRRSLRSSRLCFSLCCNMRIRVRNSQSWHAEALPAYI